jgi:hypothetical protein
LALFPGPYHTLKVWDLETGEVLATFTCDNALCCCAYSEALKLIVAGDTGGHVHFLRLEGKRQRKHTVDPSSPQPASKRGDGQGNPGPVNVARLHHFTSVFAGDATSDFANYPHPALCNDQLWFRKDYVLFVSVIRPQSWPQSVFSGPKRGKSLAHKPSL